MSTIQLEGTIKFGPPGGPLVDVSADVFKLMLNEQRSAFTRRGTFADATETSRAGAYSATLTIAFEEEVDPSTSVAHAQLVTAIRSDSGRMAFEANFAPGATSATNPLYAGEVIVTEVSTGGEVNDGKEQEQTYPLATIPSIATS